MFAFGADREWKPGSVIESAEVPGPVFAQPLGYARIKELAASPHFAHLRELAREHADARSAAA